VIHGGGGDLQIEWVADDGRGLGQVARPRGETLELGSDGAAHRIRDSEAVEGQGLDLPEL